jgi:hypothetical protein
VEKMGMNSSSSGKKQRGAREEERPAEMMVIYRREFLSRLISPTGTKGPF